ncbi:MAG: hypothetical protein ACLUDU_14345 [Butyricimonas faecihominis]
MGGGSGSPGGAKNTAFGGAGHDRAALPAGTSAESSAFPDPPRTCRPRLTW